MRGSAVTRMGAGAWAVGCGFAALVSAGGGARAEPFFGYSGYFGGPATYYTRSNDVHQVTIPRDGYFAFGVTTYTAGGPFWGYKPSGYNRSLRVRSRRAIRVKG